MIKTLRDLRVNFDKIEKYGNSGLPNAANLARETAERTERNLVDIFSKIRGYKAEADLAVKQMEKGRNQIGKDPLSNKEMADIAVEVVKKLKTYNRAFQVKTCSSHDTAGVNTHIKEGLEQLFGARNEIPTAGAKLTLQVSVHSSKNPWPFTKLEDAINADIKEIEKKSRTVIKKRVEGGIKELEAAINKKISDAESMTKEELEGLLEDRLSKDPDYMKSTSFEKNVIRERHKRREKLMHKRRLFLFNSMLVVDVDLTVKILFEKQLKINGIEENRTRNKPLRGIKLQYKIKDRNVTSGQFASG